MWSSRTLVIVNQSVKGIHQTTSLPTASQKGGDGVYPKEGTEIYPLLLGMAEDFPVYVELAA